jgi:transcriptional regulator with XRE-family HTH domain
MNDDQLGRRPLVADRIREARKLAGLSQRQVAVMLGLHRPSVSEIESGNRRVTAAELAKLAGIFDVSVGWLIGDDSDDLAGNDPRIQLAARELSKLKPEDLDRLLKLLAKMRGPIG